MTSFHILQYIAESLLIVLLIYGYTQEDRIIAWEHACWKKTCTLINAWIRAYEGRKAK